MLKSHMDGMGVEIMESLTLRKHDERLARYAHDAWSGWMSYLFSRCRRNADGTMTIPRWAVDRWSRQATTAYDSLPESEKQSDRDEADKIFDMLTGNEDI